MTYEPIGVAFMEVPTRAPLDWLCGATLNFYLCWGGIAYVDDDNRTVTYAKSSASETFRVAGNVADDGEAPAAPAGHDRGGSGPEYDGHYREVCASPQAASEGECCPLLATL